MSILGIAGLVLGGGGVIGLAIASVPIIAALTSVLGPKLGPKLAKPLLLLAVVLCAALATWGAWTTWLHHHDKGVIEAHEQDVGNLVNAEVSAGTNQANAADAIQQAEDQARSNAVNASIDNAVAAHPTETHHATGPASQAALNSLRKRNRR